MMKKKPEQKNIENSIKRESDKLNDIQRKEVETN